MVACNDNATGATNGQSTLVIPTGTLTANQVYWCQVTGVGALSGNFQLDIDADLPPISIGTAVGDTTYGTIKVNLPSPTTVLTNQFATRLRARPQGYAGYTDQYVTGLTSKTVTNLVSGTTYDFWSMYECGAPTSNERYFSAKVSGATKSGCTNANIASGPTITPVPGHCSLVTISWPALPAAQSTPAAYRVYWRQTAPTLQAGYCLATVNGTSHTLTFSNNLTPGATYDFWYTVICTGRAMATSPITPYTACNGTPKPQGDDNNQANQVYEKDGIYYVNMPFNYLNIPAPQDMEPGMVYTVKLNEVNNTEYFEIPRESETPMTETGILNLLPNPASSSVVVRYVLPTTSDKMEIRITDLQGREVSKYEAGYPAQVGDVNLDLSQFVSGIYFVNMKANGFNETKKLVVTK